MSEQMVKDITGINDNLAGNYLRPAMIDAQELDVRRILGDALLEKLKELAGQDELDGTDAYSRLHQQFCLRAFMGYSTVARVVFRVTNKVANIGVVKNTDENAQTGTADDVARSREFYESSASAYCRQLQQYLCKHLAELPELTQNDCHGTHAHISTSYQTGCFLGGARGRKLR